MNKEKLLEYIKNIIIFDRLKLTKKIDYSFLNLLIEKIKNGDFD
ncbi:MULTISPECIES: hypothetical protein [unclassified Spiroplasma]